MDLVEKVEVANIWRLKEVTLGVVEKVEQELVVSVHPSEAAVPRVQVEDGMVGDPWETAGDVVANLELGGVADEE